jgi:heme a synthase
MNSSAITLKKLCLSLACLAFVVVLLGAYTRLADAGLGCPDWPGCYGQLTVPSTTQEINRAMHAFPHAEPVSIKAWPEMIHRYVAGLLSLGLLALFSASLYWRKQKHTKVLMPTLLMVLLFFQALLGMWTVTLLLLPLVVMGHLIGGMTIACLCFYLYRHYDNPTLSTQKPSLSGALISLGLFFLLLQIILGGWTSSNYAGLICPDFPYCYGQIWPNMDLARGFQLNAPIGNNYQGGTLATNARVAIQMVHRYGAAILSGYFIGMLAYLYAQYTHSPPMKKAIYYVIVTLILQIILGLLNVIWLLPMNLAVAHNGVALLLAFSMVHLLVTHRTLGKASK